MSIPWGVQRDKTSTSHTGSHAESESQPSMRRKHAHHPYTSRFFSLPLHYSITSTVQQTCQGGVVDCGRGGVDDPAVTGDVDGEAGNAGCFLVEGEFDEHFEL